MPRPDGRIEDWERLLLQVVNRRRIAGDHQAPTVHHTWPSRLISEDGLVHMRPGDVGVGQPAQIFVCRATGLLVVDESSVAVHRYDGSVTTQGLDGSVETTAAGVNRIELSDLRTVMNFQVVRMFQRLSSVVSFEGGGSFAFSSDDRGNVAESIARDVSCRHCRDGKIRIDGPAVARQPQGVCLPTTPADPWRDLLPQVLARLKHGGQTMDPVMLTSAPPDIVRNDGKLHLDPAAILPGERPRILATDRGIVTFDETGIAIHRFDGCIAFRGRDGSSSITGHGARRIELYDLTAVARYEVSRMVGTVSHFIEFRNGGRFAFVMDEMKNVIESVGCGVCTALEDDGVIRVFGPSFPSDWQGIGFD